MDVDMTQRNYYLGTWFTSKFVIALLQKKLLFKLYACAQPPSILKHPNVALTNYVGYVYIYRIC